MFHSFWKLFLIHVPLILCYLFKLWRKISILRVKFYPGPIELFFRMRTILNIFSILIKFNLGWIFCVTTKIWIIASSKESTFKILATGKLYSNLFHVNVSILKKPVKWFGWQINWLVSKWGKHWHEKGELRNIMKLSKY